MKIQHKLNLIKFRLKKQITYSLIKQSFFELTISYLNLINGGKDLFSLFNANYSW